MSYLRLCSLTKKPGALAIFSRLGKVAWKKRDISRWRLSGEKRLVISRQPQTKIHRGKIRTGSEKRFELLCGKFQAKIFQFTQTDRCECLFRFKLPIGSDWSRSSNTSVYNTAMYIIFYFFHYWIKPNVHHKKFVTIYSNNGDTIGPEWVNFCGTILNFNGKQSICHRIDWILNVVPSLFNFNRVLM